MRNKAANDGEQRPGARPRLFILPILHHANTRRYYEAPAWLREQTARAFAKELAPVIAVREGDSASVPMLRPYWQHRSVRSRRSQPTLAVMSSGPYRSLTGKHC